MSSNLDWKAVYNALYDSENYKSTTPGNMQVSEKRKHVKRKTLTVPNPRACRDLTNTIFRSSTQASWPKYSAPVRRDRPKRPPLLAYHEAARAPYSTGPPNGLAWCLGLRAAEPAVRGWEPLGHTIILFEDGDVAPLIPVPSSTIVRCYQ